ncbi:MAG TPA: hypothetical protein VGF93_02880 [Solirubrobacteraceae bacterium]|jgi:hypothetical protein
MSRPNSEQEQEQAAAAEAARIGGSPSSGDEPEVDEAQRPLEEAGQGEAEGFELAERELIEHASHGDQHAARRAAQDAPSISDDGHGVEGGEADEAHSSESTQDDR